MKVNYNFEYLKLDQKDKGPYTIVLPIEVTPETDADFMYEAIQSVLKDQKIQGRPTFAHSTLKQFPSYCFTTEISDLPSSEGKRLPDNGRRVWCQVEPIDETVPKGMTTWIPGIEQPDGTISSVLGLLSDPESPDDIRPFDDCPFPGYVIRKEGSEEKNAVDPKLCSVMAIVYPKLQKPFLYQVTVAVNPSLSTEDQLKALNCKVREMIHGQCSVDIYKYKIVDPFRKSSCPSYTYEIDTRYVNGIDLEVRNLTVSIQTVSKEVLNVIIPVGDSLNLLFSPAYIWLNREISKVFGNDFDRIVEIHEEDGIVVNLPIILPDQPFK